MPLQHTFKPKHLALAISLALACVELANAQQSSEVADSTAVVNANELPETNAKEMALERLKGFLTDPSTVPIAFKTPEETFKGTAVNDLITLTDGASFTGLLDGGAGDNVLFLDAAAGGELKDTRNFNGLLLSRGDWTLSSKGDFKDGVLVNSGTALTNLGGIKGDVYVERGGSFAGKGAVGSLEVAGLLSVNGALGSPRVKGDLRLSPTAELAYEVTPSGSQTIKVDGTARLEGATLNVVAVPGEYPQSRQYKIIEAGKVEGEFGKVLNNLAFMTATPQYNKKSVGLTYARNGEPLASVATTDNGRAVADSIVEPQTPAPFATPTPTPTPLTASASVPVPVPVPPSASTLVAESVPSSMQDEPLTAQVNESAEQPAPAPLKPANAAVAALLTSDKTTAPVAIEQLAAGSNANLAKATLSSITPVSASMLSAMQQLNSRYGSAYGSGNSPRQAAGGADSGRVWIQALGHGGKVDREFDSTLKHATQGLVMGADWRLDEQWHIGLVGGKSQTRLDARQYDGDLDSWHLGAYAVRQDGPFSLRLGATYASHDGHSKRRVAFNGFSDRLKGNYDANTQQAFAELAVNVGRHNATLEPFASLGYQRYQRDSYSEKGGDAALKVFGQTRDNLSSTFGLRTAKITRLDNGMTLTPRFSAGWKHTFGEIESDTRQQLVKGGKRFEVAGAALDRNSLSVDAGLDLGLSANHSVGVGLTGEMATDSRTHGVMGQWRMAF
ncbi:MULTISPECIES: autotransporter outer membrane beta-barrel domain-containing protein [unclassified Pseudomonas]|uniref:autotransporter outer membrane beta-barrel domain-containing protein n=1 Tax=unclassified Pseudomonas TaxID=196821 RepID=UPI00027227FB|nr:MULTISPECIES: autotransporter outer membrane beta-barrel domain-containing protein [unclassified Pseudomonas]EJM04918.1 outer membrane autotransporter barrel domain-containing protein [Pseudomonas sp. GM16]EJM33165.1 outer membrane autotransporter barrel domain-containing protein [Pseudomonas sp. GM24]